MFRLIAVLAVVVLAGAAPAAVGAQEIPLFDGGQGAQRSAPPSGPPPPAPVEKRQRDGLSPLAIAGVAIAVVALIGGIWFAITRDARQAVPDRRRAPTAGADRTSDLRDGPGARGQHRRRRPAKRRKHSKQEQKRRKRNRARR